MTKDPFEEDILSQWSRCELCCYQHNENRQAGASWSLCWECCSFRRQRKNAACNASASPRKGVSFYAFYPFACQQCLLVASCKPAGTCHEAWHGAAAQRPRGAAFTQEKRHPPPASDVLLVTNVHCFYSCDKSTLLQRQTTGNTNPPGSSRYGMG